MLITSSELEQSQKLVDEAKAGRRPSGVTDADLWNAKDAADDDDDDDDDDAEGHTHSAVTPI